MNALETERAGRPGRVALVETIAVAMGEGWTVSDRFPDNVWPFLAGPGGRELGFSTPWNAKDRIEIHGSYPRDLNRESWISYRDDVPSITVRRDRGAAVIAREITKRFLPDYDRVLALAVDRAASADAHANACDANAHALAEALGVARNPKIGERDYDVRLPGWIEGYGRITASSDSCAIDISGIPVAVGVAMLRAMREASA